MLQLLLVRQIFQVVQFLPMQLQFSPFFTLASLMLVSVHVFLVEVGVALLFVLTVDLPGAGERILIFGADCVLTFVQDLVLIYIVVVDTF